MSTVVESSTTSFNVPTTPVVKPLGMEDGSIPDDCITASCSTPRKEGLPQYSRLNSEHAWCAGKFDDKTPNENSYLQIDLGSLHRLCAVATQGNLAIEGKKDYVTRYKLQFSTDEKNWTVYKENGNDIIEGNTDNKTVKKKELEQEVITRFVRFCPYDWYIWPCLSVELYGAALNGQPSSPVLQGKVETSAFTVSWDPSSDKRGLKITGHVLEVDDGKGGSFTEVYRGLECQYSFSGLSPGTSYRLRLASVSEGGISEWSKITTIRTLPANPPGQANPPTLSKTNTPQPNSLDLYWDPPKNDGGAVISGYVLEMETTETKEFVEICYPVDNWCTVKGLLPVRTYSFRVKAENEAGVGKESSVAYITTAPGPPDALRAPDTKSRSAAVIIVSWECPVENGTPVTGYTLEWKVDGQFTEIYHGPNRTYEVRKGIKPISCYSFRVKALSAAGPSPWSAVSTRQTPAASPPSAVTSLKVVQQSSSHLRLRWRHPETNGAPITSYNLKVAGGKNISFDVITGKGSEFDEMTAVIQEYDVTELRPNASYSIRIQAVNKIGCGLFSSAVLASTTGDPLPPPPSPLPPPPSPPPAPPLELASASYQSLKLKWMSRGTGVTYTLQMMDKDGGSRFNTVFNDPTTSYEVGKLQEKTEYQFRIQASNDVGSGPFSDLVSFMTTAQPPNTVKGLRVESTTASSVKVRWEPVTTVRTGESIYYILQIQCLGKDQDFLQVYEGPDTCYVFGSLPTASEFRFRVYAVRLMNPPSESPDPIKGEFSPPCTINVILTNTQWAMAFFGGFSLSAVLVAVLLTSQFGVSD